MEARDDALKDAVTAAASLAAFSSVSSIPIADAVAAARAAAAVLLRRADESSASATQAREAPIEPPSEEARKRDAAAAFADSLQQRKNSRWGGSTEIAATAAPGVDPGKERQALMVSQLSDKLAAFRRDRGADGPADAGPKRSIKLFVPEKDPTARFEKNWVAVFIGRDGINKQRFEAEHPGVRLFVRGEGTQLRGAKPKEDEVEAMHVLLEAEDQGALDKARVTVLAMLNPTQGSSALTLFDAGQIASLAEEKTTSKEECAFCGKPGHHHSKCPKRKSTFTMSGVKCATCGSNAHTSRDCRADRSMLASAAGSSGSGLTPSVFEDADWGAFEEELKKRSGL